MRVIGEVTAKLAARLKKENKYWRVATCLRGNDYIMIPEWCGDTGKETAGYILIKG